MTGLVRALPQPPERIGAEGDALRGVLDALYREPTSPWLRCNLIASIGGAVTGDDGTSDGLTGGIDRILLGVLRRRSDAVLVGAATVRAEGYRPPARGLLAVVTRSGDLRGHRLEGIDPTRLLVIRPATAAAGVRAALGDVPAVDAPDDLDGAGTAAVRALRAHGADRIVCEGGLALVAALLRGGLVDELCVTTAAVLRGAAVPLLPADVPSSRLAPRTVLVDGAGLLYASYLVERPAD